MKNEIVRDPYWKIILNEEATSKDIVKGIWKAQHGTVSESLDPTEDKIPKDFEAAIIKHQLAGNKGHYSILKHGLVSFNIIGFPHNTIMQLVRHQDSSYLVQSNRYTGVRFQQLGNKSISGEFISIEEMEKLFYVRPVGYYTDRDGARYEMRMEDRKHVFVWILECCQMYAREVNKGCPFELAREYYLPMCFRQFATLSGTLEAVWHLLDQRTKADCQDEIRHLADMIIEQLQVITPQLTEWYMKNRYGKAILAP